LYEQAILAEPNLEQAHYRLAGAYRQKGNREAAQRESEIFRQLSASAASKRESERSQLQRFVVTLKAPVH
jgi:hypothetical protein